MNGGFSTDKFLHLLADGVSVFGDVSTLIRQAISLFGWTSLQGVSDVVTLLSNGFATAYKVVKGIVENWWAQWAGTAVNFVWQGIKALLAGSGIGLIADAVSVVVSTAGEKLKEITVGDLLNVAGSALQAVTAGFQLKIDLCNSESLEQVYRSGGC